MPLIAILSYNNISLKLYFKTLQPLEFTDLENVEDEETKEEETGVKLSKEFKETIRKKLNEIGQDEKQLLDQYDLVHEAEVDYDLEDELDEIVAELNKPKKDTLLSKILKFAKVGKATPYKESEQDGTSKKEEGTEFLVRYMYTQAPTSQKPLKTDKTRDFCDEMISANKVFRKEDILAFNSQELNPGFGGGDKEYSIWLYKGGPRCNHRWTRKLYAKKGGRSLGQAISTTQAIKRGFRPAVNEKEVSVAPRNMEYAGYTKEYWDKMGFEN